MCGIVSIVRLDQAPVEPADLRRMASAVAHRGPDDAGYALFQKGTVGLGHVRLSIVDLGGGQQPLYNEDLSVAAVCNGEIYDYDRLRRMLTRQGHHLRTTSDSELIVHLYEEYGLDLFGHLNGEYAFVLWDDRRRRLVAARDHCGIKPLYYSAGSREVLFCSEVKGIYALGRIERRLSPRYLAGPALGVYLEDACPFENVQALKPGHVLVLEPGKALSVQAHYRPRLQACADLSFDEACAEVRERLTRAVERRLAADVPVHAYLSGGLDSTVVCGLMARAGASFTCFNVGFPGSPYDESEKARAVASHYGQQFETVPCTSELIAENFARAIYHTEMPLNNYNALAKLVLSRYVHSRGVKVCLTGEGSDELFAGYPYFKMEQLWRMQLAGGAEEGRAHALQERFRDLEYRSEGLLWDRSSRWKKASTLFGYPSFFQHRARLANQAVRLLYDRRGLGLTSADMPTEILRHSVDADRLAELDPFNRSRLLTFNQLYSLVIPTLGDRVEMASSLECRPPFLDRDLVDFACTLPARYLVDIDQLREKHVLREAFRDLLPPASREEGKHPFLAPAWAAFARTRAGRPLVADLLSQETIRKVGIFRPRMLGLVRLMARWCPLSRAFARKVDALIGTVLSIHLMHRLFVEQRIPCDPAFPMVDRSPEALSKDRPAA